MIAFPSPGDWREGERRKAQAHALLVHHRAAYITRARRAFLTVILANGTATADDVRRLVSLPPDVDPRCLGTVPGVFVGQKIVRRVGFAKSDRPERHASFITTWELVDAEGAARWLASNPEPVLTNETLFATSDHQNNKPGEAAATAHPVLSSPAERTDLTDRVAHPPEEPQV